MDQLYITDKAEYLKQKSTSYFQLTLKIAFPAPPHNKKVFNCQPLYVQEINILMLPFSLTFLLVYSEFH